LQAIFRTAHEVGPALLRNLGRTNRAPSLSSSRATKPQRQASRDPGFIRTIRPSAARSSFCAVPRIRRFSLSPFNFIASKPTLYDFPQSYMHLRLAPRAVDLQIWSMPDFPIGPRTPPRDRSGPDELDAFIIRLLNECFLRRRRVTILYGSGPISVDRSDCP